MKMGWFHAALVIACGVSAVCGEVVEVAGTEGLYRMGAAEVFYDGQQLRIDNDRIRRQWRIENGLLRVESIEDLRTGIVWSGTGASRPSPAPWEPIQGGRRELSFRVLQGTLRGVEAPSLIAELTSLADGVALTWRFQIFEDAGAIVSRVLLEGATRDQLTPDTSVMESFELAMKGVALRVPEFKDRTDTEHGPLMTEKVFTASNGSVVGTSGNVFIFENPVAEAGFVFIKHAPLPDARPNRLQQDILWDTAANTVQLLGHGISQANPRGYQYATIVYDGGRAGRIAAIQEYYRQMNRYVPGRDGQLMSNTWGDRSRDGRLGEAFMMLEIETGSRLGLDAVQIDDGWQKGTSKNSVNKGGVWEGFWDADSGFWTPHPERFPNGLEPIATAARRHGMDLGLWYAPDSSNEMANWRKDAEHVLNMRRKLGVKYWKFDAIDVATPAAERNVYDFLERVVNESEGGISIDLDITAQTRPGYFGTPFVGQLYVENRYTDWKNYYPHRTLRNLWLLSHYVDPVRLRMEFLNNDRNRDKYGSDPLAPGAYRPSYLFATVMFASPLAFFETSGLSDAWLQEVRELVKVWKQHRQAIHRGSIIPIGEAPSGSSWTGFLSVAADRRAGYVLIFRERNILDNWSLVLPLIDGGEYACERLYGSGEASLNSRLFKAKIPREKDFLFVRFERR